MIHTRISFARMSPVKHFSTMVEGVHGEIAVSMRPHRIIEQCGRVHYYGVEVDVCFACNLYLCGEGREDGRGDFEHLIACTHKYRRRMYKLLDPRVTNCSVDQTAVLQFKRVCNSEVNRTSREFVRRWTVFLESTVNE